jgi:hypothetical protein
MAQNPVLTSNAPLSLGPYAAAYFDGLYDIAETEYEQVVLKKDGFTSDQYLSAIWYGFPTATVKGQGAALRYETFGELYRIASPFQTVAQGFALTQEVMEDGKQIDIVEMGMKHLRNAIYTRVNVDVADVINTGFTANGPDGVPFFSAAHPGVMNNYSNLIAGNPSLTQSGFEAAISAVAAAKNPTGQPISLTVDKLVVPPQLLVNANVILGSMGRTGTANNDVNPKDSLGVVQATPALLRNLTSPTAWTVMTKGGDSAAIVYAERAPLSTMETTDGDYMAVRFAARTRYTVVAENPLGMFASTGAGA